MIDPRLRDVILRELQLVDFVITDSTTAPEVPGWDSLSHARILAAVEKEFGIRFKVAEILRLQTVGDLQAAVRTKAAEKSPS